MTRAEILQAVQEAMDNGANVVIVDGEFVITHLDGTVEIIAVPFLIDEVPVPNMLVQGTGATHYSDDMGDVIDLLDAQGVIPPVEMSFSVPELENVDVEGVEEESVSPVTISEEPVPSIPSEPSVPSEPSNPTVPSEPSNPTVP